MTRIVVHIDRLTLNGLPTRDARSVTDSLHGELARLLAGSDTPLTALQVPVVTAAALRLGAAATPGALGRAAAGAVATAISGAAPGSGK